ncbi:MAG: ABC transporter ATP-binding protein [Cytophagales bacterium]|nr:ABC transporter ATP-binding protein [Armatimonadota bacterium]
MPPADSTPVTPSSLLAPAVSLQGITMVFGDVLALDRVDLDLIPGTRHAVVGENGAGKSTLMKVLFGLLSPTAGQVRIDGAPRRLHSPADAIALGIGMVQQHFDLIGPLTVAENITLGSEVVSGPFLDRAAAEAAVGRLADDSGLAINPAARVETLSVASQQRVEILKALYRKARLVILDEPTAVLAPSEARDLWEATERLASEGRTVVFITHKLEDVMAHADFVTVLRRGNRVLSKPVAETDPGELAAAMVGVPGASASVHATDAAPPRTGAERPVPVLALRNLTVRGQRGEVAVRNASLEVRGGEILGLAGVDGSGQTEMIEAIIGLRPSETGSVMLREEEITHFSVARRRKAGIGYVPEDRLHRALVLSFSLEENAILGRQRDPEFASGSGFLRLGAMRAFLQERASTFDVRGTGVGKSARALSGGNQQKLVLARELSRRPAVLIASQPTRGLDFGASAFVHRALRAERDRGVAVLVQSLDLAEVLSLSDRVAVMLGGAIVGVVSHAEATEESIGELMTGARGA